MSVGGYQSHVFGCVRLSRDFSLQSKWQDLCWQRGRGIGREAPDSPPPKSTNGRDHFD